MRGFRWGAWGKCATEGNVFQDIFRGAEFLLELGAGFTELILFKVQARFCAKDLYTISQIR